MRHPAAQDIPFPEPDPEPDDPDELAAAAPLDPQQPYGPAFLLTSRCLRWGWRA